MFILRVRNTATYPVAWTADEGRCLQSSHLLLWYAILAMRAAGLAWFKLGGLMEITPRGIVHFKQGRNGQTCQLAGEWCLNEFGYLRFANR